MTREDKLNTLIPSINALTKYIKYYLVQCCESKIPPKEIDLDDSDLARIAISFIQLNMVLLKENIIENKGSLIYESKIDEEMLYQCMTLIATPNLDGTFTISGKTGTKEELFSFIRNKIAHGDYYYNDNDKTIVLNSSSGDVEININLFLQFYNLLIPMLSGIYKEKEYTRNILINKTKQLENKVLKTEKDVEDFLHLFTYKKFTLTKNDGGVIPPEIKTELEKKIREIIGLESRKINSKATEQKAIRKFYEKGYLLTVENKKIKDKEMISKIKKGLLSLKIDEENDCLEGLNYEYGDIISKIISPKYTKNGLVKGNFLNSEVLKQLIMLDEKNRTLQYNNHQKNIYLQNCSQLYFAEMFVSLSLAKFVSLYCYPFDDIYKKDNNYHLNREDIFDFSKLNLNNFNPEINTSKHKTKGEKEALTRLNSLIKEKDELIVNQQKKLDQFKNMSKKPVKTPEFIEKIEKVKKDLKDINESLLETLTKLDDAIKYYDSVKKDYIENSKYFENLSIIEGMRNSIAHGNIKIVNIGSVTNPYELKIEFNNIYEGEECFKMTISLYDLEVLYGEENINAINEFIDNIEKEKVLKK